MSMVPRIAFVKFDSLESRDEFLRFYQLIPEMYGFWASKNPIYEMTRIIIDKPSKTAFLVLQVDL